MPLSIATVGGKITAAFMNLVIAQVNQQALTTIIPTSVAGTGVTVSTNGKVTFTSSSTVSVNGVFSSTYDSYEISMSAPTHVASVATTMRLRLAGTDASVSNTYGSQRTYGNGSSVASANFNSTDWTVDAASGGTTVLNTLRLYLTDPGAASPTIGDAHFVNVISATNIFDGTVGLYHTASTAYDGFSIYVASGSMSGSLTVRGYNSQA